jgi:hypothetical protein
MPPKTKLAVRALESRITPNAYQLNIDSVDLESSDAVVPGQTVYVDVACSNNDNDACPAAAEQFTVTLTSASTGAQATFQMTKDKLCPGCSMGMDMQPGDMNLKLPIKFPALNPNDPNQLTPGDYTVVVDVTVADDDGSGVHEGTAATPLDFEWQFGTVGTKKGVPISIVEPGGNATFSLNGPGTGTFTQNGSNLDLAFDGNTTTGSVATSAGAAITLGNISASNPLKHVIMPNVSVPGNAAFSGGLEGLTLSDLGGDTGSKLTISAGAGAPANLYVTHIHDTAIEADAGIVTLYTGDWKDTDSTKDSLTAPFLDHLITNADKGGATTGEFDADLNLTGGKQAAVLESAVIDGNMNYSTWTLGGNVEDAHVKGDAIGWKTSTSGTPVIDKIQVDGRLSPSSSLAFNSIGSVRLGEWDGDIISAGPIGSIKAGSVNDGQVVAAGYIGSITVTGSVTNSALFMGEAGIGIISVGSIGDSTISTLSSPGSNQLSTLGALIVRGIKGSTAPAFDQTNVVAGLVGAISLASVGTDATEASYSIHVAAVASYRRHLVENGKSKWVVLDGPTDGINDVDGPYSLVVG